MDHNKLWKILRDGTTRLPDLPPKNLSSRKEATVRTEHGTMNWFKIGKGVLQGCIMSLCLFNLYAKYIMWNAGLDELQAGIKTARRNINNLRYDDTTLRAKIEEELKGLLMIVNEDSEKAGLKLNIQKTKIIVSSPITSWQIEEKKWQQWQTIFFGSKITVDGDCSHEIKKCLFLRRKAMTNLDSVLKSRDITLLKKIYIVKAMVFLVAMYRCENQIIKKAECWRIEAFELWCWRKLMKVPWTGRRSNQVSCIAGRIFTRWATRETKKSCLMKVKEESEKVGLKLSILKTKVMALGPISWWQI